MSVIVARCVQKQRVKNVEGTGTGMDFVQAACTVTNPLQSGSSQGQLEFANKVGSDCLNTM